MNPLERGAADLNMYTQQYIALMFESIMMDDHTHSSNTKWLKINCHPDSVTEEWYRDGDMDLDIVKRIIMADAIHTPTRVTVDHTADRRLVLLTQ
jgi:hypothetical protein